MDGYLLEDHLFGMAVHVRMSLQHIFRAESGRRTEPQVNVFLGSHSQVSISEQKALSDSGFVVCCGESRCHEHVEVPSATHPSNHRLLFSLFHSLF